MGTGQLILAAVRQPRVLRPYRRILLLSHMRANTSLFGHLLAENPAVDGYYELHMGYHSWKSLVRQKLLYASNDKLKVRGTYLFDKVLHNEHWVNMAVFRADKLVFMLRPPARTLPSIVSLYQKNEPDHVYATAAGAAQYYQDRLQTLEMLVERAEASLFYLDADALRTQAKESLRRLSLYLDLDVPLAEHYRERSMTGKPGGGDSSELIRSGQIIKEFQEYSNDAFTPDLIAASHAAYERTRSAILASPKLSDQVLESADGVA